MKTENKKWIMDVLKFVIAIVLAAILFYIVCPKYYFNNMNVTGDKGNIVVGVVRCNRITGEVVFVITKRNIMLGDDKTSQRQMNLPPGFELEK